MNNFKAGLAIIACLALALGCRRMVLDKKELRDFQQVNLIANNGEYGAKLQDPTLLNAWGLAFSSNGIAWVNALGGHVSELYTAEGAIVRAPVKIPSPTDTVGGLPTGIVFSGGKGFKISNGQASNFLFVGVDGVLSGWNGAANTKALVIKNNAATSSYTGLALASSGGANYIYAANFRTGKIDVWDTTFASVSMAFRDPGLPSGYAPFNIQAVGSWLYVMYAKVGPDGRDQAGPGNGFVDIFTTDGAFVKRFASRGSLNAPWGVAMAPAGFLQSHDMEDDDKSHNSGRGGHDDFDGSQPVILVGNFGDGRINVYTVDGSYQGQLQSHNKTIVIDGLWALSFPPSTATTIDPNRLYFTAGPDKETDGVFGYLIKN
ncbi:MAG: TIGR03118 family protein [Bacteroidetes bacterium]|nr:TIGR03118 family protein [Bacteroidota bacterium]